MSRKPGGYTQYEAAVFTLHLFSLHGKIRTPHRLPIAVSGAAEKAAMPSIPAGGHGTQRRGSCSWIGECGSVGLVLSAVSSRLRRRASCRRLEMSRYGTEDAKIGVLSAACSLYVSWIQTTRRGRGKIGKHSARGLEIRVNWKDSSWLRRNTNLHWVYLPGPASPRRDPRLLPALPNL